MTRSAQDGGTQRPAAVVFGAGSVGRGFLGQLFSESGYEVVFVDLDEPLVAVLAQRGNYTLRLAGVVQVEDRLIGPVRAVDGRDRDAVAREVAAASLMATAVGARALPAVGASIARGLRLRWESGVDTPLNVIICENLHDAPEQLGEHIRAALPESMLEGVSARLGLVPAVIARMSPVPTPEQRAADPALIVAEPYKVLPADRDAFAGPIPQIVGMEAVAPFGAYTARKLFIHNASHAILGYLGYQRGFGYGYEALEEGWVRSRVEAALDEAARGLIAEYGFEPVALREHMDYLLVRFSNRMLADPVVRLARDPLRKLAPADRLVGAARLAEKHGIVPEGLAWGIAGALAFDSLEDPHAETLQARIAQQGPARILRDVCGIRSDELLGELVLARYAMLRTDSTAVRGRG
jgi:mannitol-1-phosphate 5-dehydrogenase